MEAGSISFTQPLIPRVLGAFAGGLGRRLCRALAAGNLDRLAAGDFVAGVVGHLPEEIRRYRRDDRDHEERRREHAGAQFGDVADTRMVDSTENAPTATPAEIASCWLTLTSVVARLICAGSTSA